MTWSCDHLSLSPSALITLDEISTINAAYFNHTLATVAAGLNVVLWIGLVCFPFIQVLSHGGWYVTLGTGETWRGGGLISMES